MTPWLTKVAPSADSSKSVGHDAGAIGEAWRQFAQEDAATTAPLELERRVLVAWDALQHPSRRSHRSNQRRLVWALGAAAGALLLAFALHSHRAPAVTSISVSRAPVSATQDAGSLQRGLRPMPTIDTALTWTAYPALQTETLQLVRVRMPRWALQAVGVVVSEPNADGFVEVDVVVGEDGLPRDLRRIALIR
jgi:hypothetical protein